MVAEVCAAAGTFGVRRISLNFAVFRSVFEEGARIGAGPVLRLWRGLLLFFSRWWQLEALYRSNAKFQPEWYPRFICYGDTGSLARIGLASGIAEGFVSVPSLRKLWARGTRGPDPTPRAPRACPRCRPSASTRARRRRPPIRPRACPNRSASATVRSTGCSPTESTPIRWASRPAPTPSPRSARGRRDTT